MDLLERDGDLAQLAAWLEAASHGSGCLTFAAGEAGVGKTTLVQRFAEQPNGARVLWGACDALLTPQPLAPLHDIARRVDGPLAGLLGSDASRAEIFAATLYELERTRSLMIFEDLHWADEATLDLLKYLGRRIRSTPSMLVATYRDDEIGPRHPLRMVIGGLPRNSTRRLALAPLSEAAVAGLAKRAGRPAADLFRITGGNPLFVTEVLASAEDSVPTTVRDAVLARAGHLSRTAREVAELVSVVPGKAETWLVEQALHLNEEDIEDCGAIGLMRSDDSCLNFRHELVRRAIEASLSQSQLHKLHGRVLRALESRAGTDPARLAHHANGAHAADQALRYATIAGDKAAVVGAHREAVAHYEVALSSGSPLEPGERARLQERLADEYNLTAQHKKAADMACQALAFWRASQQPLEEGRLLCALSSMTWSAGDLPAALQYARDAICVLERLPTGADIARAYAMMAGQDMEWHETNSAIAWARQSLAIAEPLGESDIVIDALNAGGTARLINGDLAGWNDLKRALALALSGSKDARIAGCYTNLSAMAVSRREYPAASAYLDAGIAYSLEHDLDTFWLYLLAYRARMRFEQGEWNGAGDDAGVVVSHPLATPITRVPALRTLGHLRIRRGDPDADTPLLEARKISAAAPQLQRMGSLAAVLAEGAWLADDHDRVIHEVRDVYEQLQSKRDPRMKGELAAWLWRAGALELVPDDVAEPYALEMAGSWQAAAQAWKDVGCPYEQACMLAWYGAEADQREALAIFERLGALPAAQLLRRKMRATGVPRIPRGLRPSTRINPHGLTRREAEILELISQGLRNAGIAKRLFLSTKTVDHHVSAILSKLGVPSRAEAALMARQLSHPKVRPLAGRAAQPR